MRMSQLLLSISIHSTANTDFDPKGHGLTPDGNSVSHSPPLGSSWDGERTGRDKVRKFMN